MGGGVTTGCYSVGVLKAYLSHKQADSLVRKTNLTPATGQATSRGLFMHVSLAPPAPPIQTHNCVEKIYSGQ